MFWLFIMLLAAQRIAEMIVARRNEQKVKKLGAVEYGEGHYPFLVLMHVLFLSLLQLRWRRFKNAFSKVGRHYMYHFICTGDQVLGAIIIRAVLEYENSCRAGCGACQKGAVQVDEAPELRGRHLRIYFSAAVIRSVLDTVSLFDSQCLHAHCEDSRRRESARRKHRKIEIENHSHS